MEKIYYDFSYSGVFLIYLLSQLTYEYSYALIVIYKKKKTQKQTVNDTRKFTTIQVTVLKFSFFK